MSDTKWRKLFVALRQCWGWSEKHEAEREFIVKFVTNPEPKPVELPFLHPPWAWVETRYGQTPLRSIEWLEFAAEISIPRPNNVPARVFRRDVEIVAKVAGQLGCHVVPVEGGIRIMGYSR